jgi:hypothetical protein
MRQIYLPQQQASLVELSHKNRASPIKLKYPKEAHMNIAVVFKRQ